MTVGIAVQLMRPDSVPGALQLPVRQKDIGMFRSSIFFLFACFNSCMPAPGKGMRLW